MGAGRRNRENPKGKIRSSGSRNPDPEEAIAGGFLIPISGYRGFGLALALDILCGVMTGGAFLDKMKGMYSYLDQPSLIGHMMLAINPLFVMNRGEFKNPNCRCNHRMNLKRVQPFSLKSHDGTASRLSGRIVNRVKWSR